MSRTLGEWRDADGDPLSTELTLRPARLKWVGIFLISAGFVAIAIFLGDEMDGFMRWLCGGFFALCGLVAIPQMIGVGSELRLDAKGFTCVSLFRTWRREWKDCSEFFPVRVGGNMMVGYATSSDEAARPRMSAFSRGLTGTQSALPDTYGLSADDLADLMNRYRARALDLSR